jgi:hypothetical protein
MTTLGRVQRAALILAARPQGCTGPDVAPVAVPRVATEALHRLGQRGYVRAQGVRLSAKADSRGRPPKVWVITEAGRELLTGVPGSAR